MAEQNREQLHIRLHVYNEDIDVFVDRSNEEYYRAAAKHITDRYNVYAQKYKMHKSDHTIALMTLLDIALQYQMLLDKNDTERYVNILNSLTAEMEEALGDKK